MPKNSFFLASTRKLICNSQFSYSTRIRSAQLNSTRIHTWTTRFDSHSQNLDSNPSLAQIGMETSREVASRVKFKFPKASFKLDSASSSRVEPREKV